MPPPIAPSLTKSYYTIHIYSFFLYYNIISIHIIYLHASPSPYRLQYSFRPLANGPITTRLIIFIYSFSLPLRLHFLGPSKPENYKIIYTIVYTYNSFVNHRFLLDNYLSNLPNKQMVMGKLRFNSSSKSISI